MLLLQEDNDFSFIELSTTVVYKQTRYAATFGWPEETKCQWADSARAFTLQLKSPLPFRMCDMVAAAIAFLKIIWFETVDDSQQVHAACSAQAHSHSVSVTTSTTECLQKCALC